MKLRKAIILMLTLLSFSAKSQTSVQDEIRQAENIEKNKGALVALKRYKGILEKYPNNITALQNASLAASRLVKLQSTAKLRLGFAQMAYNYGNKAYRLNKKSAHSNYVLAVAEGLKALESGINEKASLAKSIGYHCKNTVKLDPNHKYGHHLVGKYYYELSQLNSLEKAIASKVLGSIPENALDLAINEMKRCYEINSSFIANMSDLALAYHKIGEDKTARFYLNKALKTKNTFPEDDYVKNECRALLRVLN